MLDSPDLCDFCKAATVPGGDGLCPRCAAIAEKVKARRQEGDLPPSPLSDPELRAEASAVVVRVASGAGCSVCDEAILGEHHEYQAPDGQLVQMHLVCYSIWAKLRVL